MCGRRFCTWFVRYQVMESLSTSAAVSLSSSLRYSVTSADTWWKKQQQQHNLSADTWWIKQQQQHNLSADTWWIKQQQHNLSADTWWIKQQHNLSADTWWIKQQQRLGMHRSSGSIRYPVRIVGIRFHPDPAG